MKKLLFTFIAILFLNACSKETSVSLQGKTFILKNTTPDITLSFDSKELRFYGKAVNNYFGTYTAKDGKITLNLVGSTMMSGPENEMEQEQTYFKNLTKIKTYTLKHKILQLKGDNVTLTYKEQ